MIENSAWNLILAYVKKFSPPMRWSVELLQPPQQLKKQVSRHKKWNEVVGYLFSSLIKPKALHPIIIGCIFTKGVFERCESCRN